MCLTSSEWAIAYSAYKPGITMTQTWSLWAWSYWAKSLSLLDFSKAHNCEARLWIRKHVVCKHWGEVLRDDDWWDVKSMCRELFQIVVLGKLRPSLTRLSTRPSDTACVRNRYDPSHPRPDHIKWSQHTHEAASSHYCTNTALVSKEFVTCKHF